VADRSVAGNLAATVATVAAVESWYFVFWVHAERAHCLRPCQEVLVHPGSQAICLSPVFLSCLLASDWHSHSRRVSVCWDRSHRIVVFSARLRRCLLQMRHPIPCSLSSVGDTVLSLPLRRSVLLCDSALFPRLKACLFASSVRRDMATGLWEVVRLGRRKREHCWKAGRYRQPIAGSSRRE
jgi:hypothetical protein